MRATIIVLAISVTAAMAGCNTSTRRGEADGSIVLQPATDEQQASGPAAPVRTRVGPVGRDVYRTHCQGCHGPAARGTPRAPALTRAARALASGGGEDALRGRLQSGGKDMPAFAHLTAREVDALVAYLSELGAGSPGGELPAGKEPRERGCCMMRGRMMHRDVGCPMNRGGSPAGEREQAPAQAPRCCR